jgi:hypothetical protein
MSASTSRADMLDAACEAYFLKKPIATQLFLGLALRQRIRF